MKSKNTSAAITIFCNNTSAAITIFCYKFARHQSITSINAVPTWKIILVWPLMGCNDVVCWTLWPHALDPDSDHMCWILTLTTCVGSWLWPHVLDPNSDHMCWILTLTTCVGFWLLPPMLDSDSDQIYWVLTLTTCVEFRLWLHVLDSDSDQMYWFLVSLDGAVTPTVTVYCCNCWTVQSHQQLQFTAATAGRCSHTYSHSALLQLLDGAVTNSHSALLQLLDGAVTPTVTVLCCNCWTVQSHLQSQCTATTAGRCSHTNSHSALLDGAVIPTVTVHCCTSQLRQLKKLSQSLEWWHYSHGTKIFNVIKHTVIFKYSHQIKIKRV